LTGALLKQSSNVFHEFVVVEVDAHSGLKLIDVVLLKQQVVALSSRDALLWGA
jgi:hypothetical protein